MNAESKRQQIGIKMNPRLIRRLRRASDKSKNPLAPSQTQIIEHGVDLALKKIEKENEKEKS